ncbi:unnamed protein product, partial [Closterium sp. Naga37s-1]
VLAHSTEALLRRHAATPEQFVAALRAKYLVRAGLCGHGARGGGARGNGRGRGRGGGETHSGEMGEGTGEEGEEEGGMDWARMGREFGLELVRPAWTIGTIIPPPSPANQTLSSPLGPPALPPVSPQSPGELVTSCGADVSLQHLRRWGCGSLEGCGCGGRERGEGGGRVAVVAAGKGGDVGEGQMYGWVKRAPQHRVHLPQLSHHPFFLILPLPPPPLCPFPLLHLIPLYHVLFKQLNKQQGKDGGRRTGQQGDSNGGDSEGDLNKQQGKEGEGAEGGSGSKETATEGTVKEMYRRLKRAPRHRVQLPQLLLSRTSFAHTVENMFALSFLVKEGRVGLTPDPTFGAAVDLRPPTEPASGSAQPKGQFIMRLDINDWK